MMYLCVIDSGPILDGSSVRLPALYVYSLQQRGEVSFHYIFKEVFISSLFYPSPSVSPMSWVWVGLRPFQRLLSLSVLYWLYFLPSCIYSSFFDAWIHVSLFPNNSQPALPKSYLPPSLLSPFGFVHRPFLRVLSRPFPFLCTLWPYSLRSGYPQFVLPFSDSGQNL